ncbi:MAG: MerR family transcriptional regulator [Solirubrobacteraceae bacterium]
MSELAERSGVSAPTIRHYIREGLLGDGEDIHRTSRNMAYYPPELVERIQLIKRLQEERFMPLRVIKEVLDSHPERVKVLLELEDKILERALASEKERELLDQLAAILGSVD